MVGEFMWEAILLLNNLSYHQTRNMTDWWPIWGWNKFAPRQNEQLKCSPVVFTLPQDDILTAAYCPPNYLATASFDGDIILWGLDREKMIRRLKKGSGSLLWVANALTSWANIFCQVLTPAINCWIPLLWFLNYKLFC